MSLNFESKYGKQTETTVEAWAAARKRHPGTRHRGGCAEAACCHCRDTHRLEARVGDDEKNYTDR